MSYTTEIIDELIVRPKRVSKPPSKEFKEENRHRRKDMELVGVDGGDFSVFIRQSLEFPEDFSLGLLYILEGKRILLVRYNGQHEQTDDVIKLQNLHFQYHIHKASPENLNNGRLEKHASTHSANYASFEEATTEFLTDIGIDETDISKHFPLNVNMPLFKGKGA